MPIDHRAGYSEDTAVKQRDFSYVLGVLLKVAQSCMRQEWAHREFLYFDLNAGPGAVGGIEGSPLIFTRLALQLGLPFRAFFFEQDDDSAESLRLALEAVTPPAERHRLRIVRGDHCHGVPWVLGEHLGVLTSRQRKWAYGLAYGDGNGKTDAPFAPMADLASAFPRVDLLLNVNATVYKRQRGGDPAAGFLLDDVSGIRKAHRLIRKPVGIHQWTMVFQTNWSGAPEFGQIGFRNLRSAEGRAIAEKVNFSKREIGVDGPPFVTVRPTGPMPSISVTRGSSPFGGPPSSVAAASASGATRQGPRSRTT